MEAKTCWLLLERLDDWGPGSWEELLDRSCEEESAATELLEGSRLDEDDLFRELDDRFSGDEGLLLLHLRSLRSVI